MSAFEDALTIAEAALRRNFKNNGLPRKRVTKEAVARFLLECGIIIVKDQSGISRMLPADEPIPKTGPLFPFIETSEESGGDRADRDSRQDCGREDSMDVSQPQISRLDAL